MKSLEYSFFKHTKPYQTEPNLNSIGIRIIPHATDQF